ncbi:hypothetical protein L7F22_066781 [Adiantum nelumboides]|nr:hypothetical protein [Adiantum nelumboides]
MHHHSIWRDIRTLLAPLIPILKLNEEDRLQDWVLVSNSPGSKSVSMQNWTSRQIYRAILPPPWIQAHGNLLWHMYKSMQWWKSTLSSCWKSRLPLKHRLFLWRCLLGILPAGFSQNREIFCWCFLGNYLRGFLLLLLANFFGFLGKFRCNYDSMRPLCIGSDTRLFSLFGPAVIVFFLSLVRFDFILTSNVLYSNLCLIAVD